MLLIFASVLFSGYEASAKVLSGDIGRLPSLGFNSWNAFGCNINEDIFLNAARVLVDEGLKDAGYTYVNIDDCWSVKSGRDNDTGRILPDYTKFPDGINGTAEKIHDMGLQIGIYSSAGEATCGGYPASLGHETVDAETFAEWGIDYLKYDNCYSENTSSQSSDNDTCKACVPDRTNQNSWVTSAPGANGTCTNSNLCSAGYDYSKSTTYSRYKAMSDALASANRSILFNMCVWGRAKPSSGWGADISSSWRITGDIYASWSRIVQIINQASFQLDSVGFGSHIDMDMLEIGNSGLSDAEVRSHMALWAGFKSPLLIGANLSNIATSDLGVLKNQYLLAFSQDKEVGEGVKPYKWGTNADWTFNETSPAEFYSGSSSNGTLVLMFNPSSEDQSKTASFSEIPELSNRDSFTAIDIWSGEDLGCVRGSYTSQTSSHDTTAILFGKAC